MNKDFTIYIKCPDSDEPIGGIKQLYRHVDILNKNGFDAYILHHQYGFRCSWFQNNTRIVYERNSFALIQFLKEVVKYAINYQKRRPIYLKALRHYLCSPKTIFSDIKNDSIAQIKETDYLILPEMCGSSILDIYQDVPKVIFVQNPYLVFSHHPLDKSDLRTPYLGSVILATFTFSEYCHECIQLVFPEMNVFRIRYGFDKSLFYYPSKKKKQICYMPRKLPLEAQTVVNMLKFRARVKDYDFVPINSLDEKQTSEIMRESLIFLSFCHREGFGMPIAEAMACGCTVIGFHGNGGKELFRNGRGYPIEHANLSDFVHTIEDIASQYDAHSQDLLQKSKSASESILNEYSLKNEEADILSAWRGLLEIPRPPA